MCITLFVYYCLNNFWRRNIISCVIRSPADYMADWENVPLDPPPPPPPQKKRVNLEPPQPMAARLIIVTRRTARMRKIAFNFIVNMAIADLCTTIINMPESLFVEIKDSDEWISGDIGIILCKLLPFCQQVCSFCSILSLLTIAFDNFFAICLPLKKPMTRKLSRIIITITWLIPCITSVPMFLANNVLGSEGILLCLEEWPVPIDSMMASRTYTIILFILFYMVPLISISVLYSCVFYEILNRKVVGNHSAKT